MKDTDFLPKKEEEVNFFEMDPWQIIKESAQAMGIIVYDPKPNCKKCHGRGYIGRHTNTGEPVACTCIFPKPERDIGDVTYKPVNRAERRAQKKKA